MSGDWWSPPVRVMIGPSLTYNVTSLSKAAELLLYKWPGEHGARHRRAQRLVLAAMERPGDPAPTEAARAAFEAAAREADILVEG